MEDVNSELFRRMNIRMNGGCKPIKHWGTSLLRLGEKVEVIGERKEITIESKYNK